MIQLSDFSDPFDAVLDFENRLAQYTGAPYVITTDSCTHAIELCLRHLKPLITLSVPHRTYLSVPMTMHKLGISFEYTGEQWIKQYQFSPTPIWDSARNLEKNMYIPEQFMCLSFGRTKPLEIGRGGAILTDDKDAYEWLKRASYDGRDLSISPWQDQVNFNIGYHYMMRPEECVEGINRIISEDIKTTYNHTYPDLREIKIT